MMLSLFDTFSRVQRKASSALTLQRIAVAVCEHYGLTYGDLHGRSRKREIAWPRQMFCLLARELTAKSYPQIASFLGRDHTTIMHGVAVQHERLSVPYVKADHEIIRAGLNQ